MTQIMLVDMPQTEKWKCHLSQRLVEAKEIGLLQEAISSGTDPLVFIPSNPAIESLDKVDPAATSLRSLTSVSIGNGWISRPDIFEGIAKWILEQPQSGIGHIILEAGYSRAGDEALSHYTYRVHNGSVLLTLTLAEVDEGTLSRYLRAGRGWRLLGVIETTPDIEIPARNGSFICDALDCDSMLVCSFRVPAS